MNVSKQYLVPKDGTPLQGLIQDHVIAGAKLLGFFEPAIARSILISALNVGVVQFSTLKPYKLVIKKPELSR